MSTWVSNSYVRVPPDLNPMEVLENVHAHLLEACECDKDLASKWLEVRLRHQTGAEWICLYGIGFESMKEAATIEVLRSITQKYVDEVIMLFCFGVVSFGAYGHFMEGTLVRFTAQCEDWTEKVGAPEPWESELIDPAAGLYECTIVDLGKKLELGEVANHSIRWDIDVPLFQ